MGKSPGKWIKTVLFGKKYSKSNLPKDVTIEKKASIITKAPSGDLAVSTPVISDLPLRTTDISGEKAELEKGTTTSLPCGTGLNSVNDAELTRQEQAATKAQAAFRGYLARRAFWALKGIIRLQALVRGHLVRRQAVATLRCMRSIVKFQALVRGRRVRLSDAGYKVLKKCSLGEPLDVKGVDLLGANRSLRSEKLSTNVFVIKLLASSPTGMPLSLQYDLDQPNSAWNWLDRWSSTNFWEPLARPKKIRDAKPTRKQANMKTEEKEAGRPKRGVRKIPAINSETNLSHSSEYEKPKRNPRKVSSHQAESVQEQPQNELEKVKRSLRKVSITATVASDKSEDITEKLQHNLGKVSISPTPDVSEQGMDQTSGKIIVSTVAVSVQPVAETTTMPLGVDKLLDVLHDDLKKDDHPDVHSVENSGKVENSPTVNGELSSVEDQTSKENQRTRRRSFPVKQEYPESVSQNTATLPSYMAATESAKAKLRAQGSPGLGEDEAENGFIRRHSLPSSTNTKLSSLSPRMQKPVQANGKGGIKSNKSLISSRDEKVLQAGWRR